MLFAVKNLTRTLVKIMYPTSSNRKLASEEHETQIGRLYGRQRYADEQRKVSFTVDYDTHEAECFMFLRLCDVSMSWIWPVK